MLASAFIHTTLGTIWHDSDIFSFALEQTNLTKSRNYLAKVLAWVAELIFNRMDEKYFSKSLATYTRRYSLYNNLKTGPTPADFDNYLYDFAAKVWPHVIQLIEGDFGGAV